VLRRPETRVPDEEQQLAQLTAQQAELAEAVTLARDFADLVRTRQPDRLDGWLARAATSPVTTVQRFAQGLRDDYAAVRAGLTLPWSNVCFRLACVNLDVPCPTVSLTQDTR
jgi:transposase